MDTRFNAKSDLYVFVGYIALLVVVAFNPFTIPLLQSWGIVPTLRVGFMHNNDILIFLPLAFDLVVLVTAFIIIRAPRHLFHYLNNSRPYNIFLLLTSLFLLLTSNVVLPGKFLFFRILFLLFLIYLLTNTLYLLVIKKRKESPHTFYKNVALALYSIGLTLLILEGVFMFFNATHRFNGTLASRSWFMRHWELNSEGYRDVEYDDKLIEGKRKVIFLGDSFVAGHGIDDPEDRFSDLLDQKIPDFNYSFNLGVGGSDVLDAYQRLEAFPYEPDFLIFSYYLNDIDLDAERAGLEIARARSYDDVFLPFRFFVRRSYLLNNLYWRFPHGGEMADYEQFVKQCYTDSTVMDIHTAHLDSIVYFAQDRGIPMLAMVWPFLDRVEWSEFATTPILEHFEERGVYTMDIREMLLGREVKELVVNNNDAHPSAALHVEIADSLYEMLLDYNLLD